MLELLSQPEAWLSLLTLTFLEIVLGIDNVVFVSVAASRLPQHQQPRARTIGLLLALLMRIGLLLMISWIVGLTQPVFAVEGFEVSWRDIILFSGGLFLIYKATHEIHAMIDPDEPDDLEAKDDKPVSFTRVIFEIVLLDAIFSLDSVITAVGMVDHIEIMVTAVVIAMGVMLVATSYIAAFIHRHPTTKMLALSFLLLIGVALVGDGLHFHIPRGYIYFAIAFSIAVEAANLMAAARRRKRRAAKQAH